MAIGLTRQDKEKLVFELYNQGMTYHDIAKEARVSLRDIGPILKKSGIEQSLSLSSQAYKLFFEGKSPNEVAIALNIREPDATQFYREYWRLNQLYDLDQIYEETKGNFSSLVELYRQMKTAGMTVAHVIKLLGVANNDIRSIEYRRQELRREAGSLEASNRSASQILEQLSSAISETQNILNYYESMCKQQRSEMNRLFHQKTQLEEFIEYFKNNNAEYIKAKENIKREVQDTLTNSEKLIQLALSTLIESVRRDINKFQLLCYQMSTDIMAPGPSQSLTSSYSGQNWSISNMNEKLFQGSNAPTEAFQSFVINEAKKLYDKLIDDSLNKIDSKPNNSLLNVSPCLEPLVTGRFDIRSSPSSQKLAFAYRKEEEERIFIESESKSTIVKQNEHRSKQNT